MTENQVFFSAKSINNSFVNPKKMSLNTTYPEKRGTQYTIFCLKISTISTSDICTTDPQHKNLLS